MPRLTRTPTACLLLLAACDVRAQVPLPSAADSARRDSAQTFAGWPRAASRTSPAGGDTAGYWQQRADYRIIAALDERREVLTASGTLTYVNRSPDTLRELFLHQHLNAFRPGSRWAAADAREGRVRFQTLGDPAHAFERFTRAPVVGGVPVAPEYPGAPDSTVVRLALPRPLAPGDSVRVELAWEARPSTIPRRQGRLGRSYDFAQWYPKVAVYDRGGWQPHALVPAGEFYGEFGEFDVTLVLDDDQVVGATGVPVEGDPGWARASRTGPPVLGAGDYGRVEPGPMFKLPAGRKRVRFVARDVHHFGWSTSPDYRYEGGAYVRARPAGDPFRGRVRVWDTVRVHALYRPGDDSTWGGGRTVARTVAALGWLERVYGPYAYPQMTVVHRLSSGGTEFPMLQMNGDPSQGLVLHEGGHLFTYGILANNEWQSGWMDEGLTSYQTDWALGLARHALALDGGRAAVGAQPSPRALAAARAAADGETRAMEGMVRAGVAGPMGERADRFATFDVYNAMVYARGAQFYSALRDVLGEAAFAGFLRRYYTRWALRHVDEAAMRTAAEQACQDVTFGSLQLRLTADELTRAGTWWPCDFGWLFDQWVRGVGVIDYAVRDLRPATRRDQWGEYTTTLTLVRTGTYRHPMPVGVRTDSGWTVLRSDPRRDVQRMAVRTKAPPREVRLDPFGTVESTTTRYYVWPKAARDLKGPSTGRGPGSAEDAMFGGLRMPR